LCATKKSAYKAGRKINASLLDCFGGGGRWAWLVGRWQREKIELHASQQLLCPPSAAFESVSVRVYRRRKTTVIAWRTLRENSFKKDNIYFGNENVFMTEEPNKLWGKSL